ncbi:MAG: cation-translocating P-type ATPase [Bacillota bacterium]
MEQDYYKMDLDNLVEKFSVDRDKGLKQADVQERLNKYGQNKIKEAKGISVWKVLLNQLRDILIIILIVASGLAFLIGDELEAIAILVVIIFNTVIGFATEYQAQKAMASLKDVLTKKAVVLRDGEKSEIEAKKLVPGDLIFLEEGDSIPADARLLTSKNLSINEAALTGESESVAKNADEELGEDKALADRSNMVYMGTTVVRGAAKVIVTATGDKTEIGKIGAMLDDTKEAKTPLEERLDKLGKSLVVITLFVIAILTGIGILMGRSLYTTVSTGIALAIAAVPEGLPIIATITLAIGMKKMVKNNALTRELLAVETLGSVTTICTDKTGTITANQMTLQKLYLNGEDIKINGTGYAPDGEFYRGDEKIDPGQEDIELALRAGALCTSAELQKEDGQWKIIGEPTEGALLTAAGKAGFSKQELENKDYTEIAKIPFDSDVMYMAKAYQTPAGEQELYLKGSPEVVLDMCKSYLKNGEILELTESEREKIKEKNLAMGKEGLRILGIAYQQGHELDSEEKMRATIEDGLIFVALTGIIDPPRESVKEALQQTKKAGIKTKMITGDQKETAMAIARDTGISNSNQAITGEKISAASGDELSTIINDNSVFCRVTPKNKLQIIDALNKNNEVTAMTGDGVNDAPALKKADIGVSMGQRGTSVAREASDMVLLDDDFATIVKAVKEGRVIFDNIQKFIYFLFSNNLSKIIYIFLAIIFQMPMPLVAMQILWINVVIDVLPALSLAWEDEEPDIMERNPQEQNKNIMDNKFKRKVGLHSLILALGPLAVFLWSLSSGQSLEISRTLSFGTLALVQLFHVFNARRKSGLAFGKTLFTNLYLWIAVVVGLILQIAAIYTPFLQSILATVSIPLHLWWPAIVGILIPMVLIQILNFQARVH